MAAGAIVAEGKGFCTQAGRPPTGGGILIERAHTRGLVTVENGGDGDNAPPAKRPAATSNTTDTPRL